MRVVFSPHGTNAWESLFKQQIGSGLVGYSGSRFQRGAGIGNLFSGLMKAILPMAKTAGRAIGKQALVTGVNVANDALQGRNVKEALEQHGKRGAASLLRRGARKLRKKKTSKKKQKGRGVGFRPRKRMTTASIKGGVKKRKPSGKKRRRTDQLGVYYS